MSKCHKNNKINAFDNINTLQIISVKQIPNNNSHYDALE